ncbi:MAG: BCCT family transporter [Thermodesulfobacteriota bacterium]|nr:BCCT family transporter [Thermodesulfobacteriota bacterium]
MKNHNVVYGVSLAITLIFVIFGILTPEALNNVSSLIHTWIITNFGWAYLLSTFIFVIFSIGIALSPYGNIKLGKDNEKPQFSYFGWFSMLFAAGMGIGLIFWGVAEPLVHYVNPPAFLEGQSGAAASFAMKQSYFHWGIHPWAIYIVISLAIAYFSFRRDMPTLISSCFFPLLGDRIYGFWGRLIDILAVFATIFGVSTSLGLGAMQIQSGLGETFGFPQGEMFTIAIIAVITVLFISSSITGLSKGIQILSKTNVVLMLFLLLFVFIAGPTAFILGNFTNTLGDYLSSIVSLSLNLHLFSGYDWTRSWTLFYWAWWIAWSPFVGLFIASVSRGRTIREFVFCVLLVPTLLTFAWFAVFGGAALNLELTANAGLAEAAVNNVSTVLFKLFATYPLGSGLTILAVALLTVFFVTSADSATFVLAIMTSGGNRTPSNRKKIVWGILQSSVACVLLVSGGLVALQKMAIAAALPFTVVLLLLCVSLLKAFRYEFKYERGEAEIAAQSEDG